MTDSEFPFGDDAESTTEQPAIQPTSDLRTNVLIGAGGALAAIAMAAGFVVFAGNDSDEQLAAVPSARPATVAAPKPKPAPAKGPRVEPAPATETIGRDPFTPLYRAPVAAVPASNQVPVAPAPAMPIIQPAVQQPVPAPAQPAAQPAPAPAQPVVQPAPAAPAQTTSYQMRMIRVYEQDGNLYTEVTVNGTVHRPRAGETFGQYFQLVATQDPCATYLFGDEQFRLCVGEITVRQ